MGHALAVAAQDAVKTTKFVETSVLPALKTAQANEATIESITSLVSPSAANIDRAGFAVLGVVMAQSTRKKHCGQCGLSGHSIRTCSDITPTWRQMTRTGVSW